MPKLPRAAADTRPGPRALTDGARDTAGRAPRPAQRLCAVWYFSRPVYGQSALGATEDTAQPGRRRTCSQHGLLGTLSPSLRPLLRKKSLSKHACPWTGRLAPPEPHGCGRPFATHTADCGADRCGTPPGRRPPSAAAGIASRAWAPRAGLQHGGHTTAALPGTPGHPSSPVRLAARRRPERKRRAAPAPGTARAPRRTNTGSWTPRPAAARLPQTTWKYSLESTGGRAGASPTAERRLQRQPHQKLPFGLFRIFCGLTRILVFQNICTYINKATGISTEIALNFNNINVLDP